VAIGLAICAGLIAALLALPAIIPTPV